MCHDSLPVISTLVVLESQAIQEEPVTVTASILKLSSQTNLNNSTYNTNKLFAGNFIE